MFLYEIKALRILRERLFEKSPVVFVESKDAIATVSALEYAIGCGNIKGRTSFIKEIRSEDGNLKGLSVDLNVILFRCLEEIENLQHDYKTLNAACLEQIEHLRNDNTTLNAALAHAHSASKKVSKN